MRRTIHSGFMDVRGQRHWRTLLAAHHLCKSLPPSEGIPFTRKQIKLAEEVHGVGHRRTLQFGRILANHLVAQSSCTLNDAIEAVKISREGRQATLRLLGTQHHDYMNAEETARESCANLVSTLTRLDMSPEELRARGARANAARAWDALVAENAALRREVESLRREKACVTPSPDSESDLD